MRYELDGGVITEDGNEIEITSYELRGKLNKIKRFVQKRLKELLNPFHNYNHSRETVGYLQELLDNLKDPTMFSEQERLLALDSALRHDDLHCGTTYRQDREGNYFSNEEIAIGQMDEDYTRAGLSASEINYSAGLIASTSFGQSEFMLNKRGKSKKYKRDYKPETSMQKLLHFADLSAVREWGSRGFTRNFALLEENPYDIPETINDFIKTEENFLSYVNGFFEREIKDLLKPEFSSRIEKELQESREKINSVKQRGSDPDYREECEGTLDRLRDKYKTN